MCLKKIEKIKEYQKNYREAKKHASQNANMLVKVCYKYIFKRIKWCFNNNNKSLIYD